jgi:[ribosomal protein S5]-alanine N-acetyltransferase
MTFPTLHTHRLTLREIVAGDAAAIMIIRGDYEVTRHNIGAAYTDIAQAHGLIDGIAEDVAGGVPRWAIALRDDDTLIGMVGYNTWDRHDQRASVGFDLARAHWGGGIMSEALRCVIAYGFDEMRLNKIEADTSEHNVASMALLRKLGFREEGRQREQFYEDERFHDLVLWGLLKREWTP